MTQQQQRKELSGAVAADKTREFDALNEKLIWLFEKLEGRCY